MVKTLEYYYNIHNKLIIRSNKKIALPYYAENYFRVSKKDNVDLSITIKKHFPLDYGESKKSRFTFFGEHNKKYVLEKISFLRTTTKLLLKDLLGKTEVIVNPAYYRVRKVPLYTVRTFVQTIGSIILFKMLQKGCTFLHSACLSKDDFGILLPAFPDTGKTLTTLLSCYSTNSRKNNSLQYLADDLTLIDNSGMAYGSPGSFRLKDLRRANIKSGAKLEGMRQIFGKIAGYLYKLPYVPIQITSIDKIEARNLGIQTKEKTKIKLVCLLEKGKEKMKEISLDEAVRRIYTLQRNEFYYFPCPSLLAYSYFNRDIDLRKIMDEEREIILNSMKSAICYSISSMDSQRYHILLKKLLAKFTD